MTHLHVHVCCMLGANFDWEKLPTAAKPSSLDLVNVKSSWTVSAPPGSGSASSIGVILTTSQFYVSKVVRTDAAVKHKVKINAKGGSSVSWVGISVAIIALHRLVNPAIDVVTSHLRHIHVLPLQGKFESTAGAWVVAAELAGWP